MKYRKLFFVLLTILLIFSFTGCKKDDINRSNINNQVIYMYKDASEVKPSNVSEAVNKVFDSVVVIRATLNNGMSSGSGVIFSQSKDYSYIITCHHVIASATSFEVTLANGEKYEAQLVGGDPQTDIAVLSIKKTGLTIASFIADSNKIVLGSTAIAIGNPLGTLANTVTCGIISSKNRLITTSDGTTNELIQTDAAINSGNSGGGLFNANGDLVGIVSAKYSATGVEGLGFAIPANTASSIAKELCEKGYIEGRFELGVTISNYYIRQDLFSSYKVVYVSQVLENGCCDGLLQQGDILRGLKVKYQDNTESKLSDLSDAEIVNQFIADSKLTIGDSVIFTILRNNVEKTIEVKIVQYKY